MTLWLKQQFEEKQTATGLRDDERGELMIRRKEGFEVGRDQVIRLIDKLGLQVSSVLLLK